MGFIFEYYNKASSADKDQNMILINSLSFEVRNSKEGGGVISESIMKTLVLKKENV